MNRPTCTEIAINYSLWSEYIDPHATMTEQDFNNLSTSEKLETIHELFPSDCNCGHMAAKMLGRLGGSVKSERKAKSSAKNGRLGGRPAKTQPTQVAADGDNVAQK